MYTITALTESSHLKPEGDCYAPQIVLTASRGRLENITELNTESLPFTAEEFNDWRDRLAARGMGLDFLCRFVKVFYGIEAIHQETTGYSQSNWGYSFVFGTPEFYELTGATEVSEYDHNDLCAWIWGDVYEVYSKAVTHTETCSLGHDHIITDVKSELDHYIYGMSNATKFVNEHNIEIEGL